MRREKRSGERLYIKKKINPLAFINFGLIVMESKNNVSNSFVVVLHSSALFAQCILSRLQLSIYRSRLLYRAHTSRDKDHEPDRNAWKANLADGRPISPQEPNV